MQKHTLEGLQLELRAHWGLQLVKTLELVWVQTDPGT